MKQMIDKMMSKRPRAEHGEDCSCETCMNKGEMVSLHKNPGKEPSEDHLDKDDNHVDMSDSGAMSMAKAIRMRRARMERTQPADDGMVNYATGGAVMGEDDDGGEELGGMMMDSDDVDDDFLSQDEEGSLFKDEPYDMNEGPGRFESSSRDNSKKKSSMKSRISSLINR